MFVPSIYHQNLFDDFFDGFPFFGNDMNPMERPPFDPHAPHAPHDPHGPHAPHPHVPHVMSTDIKEKENAYEMEMELPGFKKEDIQIQLEDGYLMISASKNIDKDVEEDGHFIRRERYTGSCSRSFYVGKDITHEDVKAGFQHGVLKLTIPKKDAKAALPEKKYIAIEG